MSFRLPCSLVVLVAALGILPGCRGTHGSHGGGCSCDGAPPSGPITPVPGHATGPTAPEEGGQLLKTGAIQLGPGVQKNAWRWQGDGQGGF
jgi:hypothetical protein